MCIIGVNLTFKYKFLPSFDVLLFTGTELYISPWTRIMPYAVGVACGWFLNKYRETLNVSDVRENSMTLIIYKNFFFFARTETPQFLVLFIDIYASHHTACNYLEGHVCASSVIVHFTLETFDCHCSELVHYNECMWL